MKDLVFVDSGYWIALVDQRDQNHSIAKNALKPLLYGYRICVSDFIIFETLTYFNCSLKRHDLALNFLKKTESPGLSVLIVDEAVKVSALEKFKQYSDTDLSVTDCTSFVLMESQRIHSYAGFDDHFNQMGFIRIFSQLHLLVHSEM